MVTKIFYQMVKLLHKLKLVRAHIISDNTLTQDEKNEKYFWYEVKNGSFFDQRFKLNLEGKIILEIGTGFGGYAYHALQSKATFFYGIDINEEHIRINNQLLNKYYQGNNYEMIAGSANDMSGIGNAKVDVIVSNAVIEHISERDKMFSEIKRILNPGGHAYICTSPIWKSWNGAHMARYIPIPWSHLFLPDKLILRTLKMQKENSDFPAFAIDNMIGIYTTIGKLTIRRLKKEIANSGLELISFQNYSRILIKKIMIKIPFLDEFFAGDIRFHLRKRTN